MDATSAALLRGIAETMPHRVSHRQLARAVERSQSRHPLDDVLALALNVGPQPRSVFWTGGTTWTNTAALHRTIIGNWPASPVRCAPHGPTFVARGERGRRRCGAGVQRWLGGLDGGPLTFGFFADRFDNAL